MVDIKVIGYAKSIVNPVEMIPFVGYFIIFEI